MSKKASQLSKLKSQARHLHAQGRSPEAILIWRNILLARPDDVDSLYAMGRTLLEIGRLAEAEASLRVAVERAAHRAEIWITLAKALTQWGDVEEAENCLHNAIARAPDQPHPHQALGEMKLKAGDIMQAMAAFQAALDRDQGFSPAQTGMGKGWWLRGQRDEAIRHFREAVKSSPRYADGHLQLSLALLAQGKGAEGWHEFEWRRHLGGKPYGSLPDLDPVTAALPEWDGHALAGQTLIITHEGGLCEALQFGRLLDLVQGGRVIYLCPAPLRALLQGAHWKADLVADNEPAPKADLRASLLSLPNLLNLDEPPEQVPYLRPDPTLLAPWRARLGDSVRIGICWRGGSRPFDAGDRHIPLEAFKPLADLEGVSLVSLQKGDGRQEMDEVPFPIHDFDSEMDDGEHAFLDSAAMIQAMTMVVSVDGAIAHLAGALGRPVWTVLPHGSPEWRWQTMERETPWYPTMDLFRCPQPGDWSGVMATLAQRLKRMMLGEDPDRLDGSSAGAEVE